MILNKETTEASSRLEGLLAGRKLIKGDFQRPFPLTFMESSSRQSFEFLEAVQDVSVVFFGVAGHVSELLDVAILDAKGEYFHTLFDLQNFSRRPGVTTIAVAVGDEENDLGGVGPAVLLQRGQQRSLMCIRPSERIRSKPKPRVLSNM